MDIETSPNRPVPLQLESTRMRQRSNLRMLHVPS